MINNIRKALKWLAAVLAICLLCALSGAMVTEVLHLFAKEVANNISTQNCK